MLGLIKKDLYNLSGSMKVYIIIPILFAFLSFMNNDMTMMAFGTSFVSLFIVITSCAYDDMSQFQSFALTLPILRKDLVISKFLMGNCFSILLFVICNLLANVLYFEFGEAQFPDFQAVDFALYTILAVLAANICISILLTIIFKFGTEKGRIVFMVMFLGVGLLGGIIGNLNIDLPFDFLFSLSDEMFTLFCAILSIVVELIAIMISTHIMNKKEM